MALSFQTVIGLEIHVQLATKSKLFCSCPTDYIGATPNTNVCPVCLGQPGSLPVLNGRAVELAIMLGKALNSEVGRVTRFHRKNYFYPDLPKAYQISQYDLPICSGGHVDLVDEEGNESRVGITRAHLEEDAGKLVHGASDGRLAGAAYSLVDYNRGGVPLLEIVSEPDITSPHQAKLYVERIRQIVRYLGISDGDMESGSLRVDANISQKVSDGRWGNRAEIKNMNSLRALERGLEYEIRRQRQELSAGREIVQETRHWDDGEGVTRSSRSKEEAHDYRYFPEPDLPPVVVADELVEKIWGAMGELPWEVEDRFARDYGLQREEILVLTENRDLAAYMDAVVAAGAEPARAGNWIRTEVLRVLNEKKLHITDFPVAPGQFAALLKLVESKDLSTTAARDVFLCMADSSCTLEAALESSGVRTGKVGGNALEALIRGIVEGQPDVVEIIRAGKDKKDKKFKFLQGLVMRETRGQADPAEVARLMKEILDIG